MFAVAPVELISMQLSYLEENPSRQHDTLQTLDNCLMCFLNYIINWRIRDLRSMEANKHRKRHEEGMQLHISKVSMLISRGNVHKSDDYVM